MQAHGVMNASGISMRSTPWKRCTLLQSERLSKLQPSLPSLHRQQERLRCSASTRTSGILTYHRIHQSEARVSLRNHRQGSVQQSHQQQQQRPSVVVYSSNSTFQNVVTAIGDVLALICQRVAQAVGLAFLFFVVSGMAPHHATASSQQ